MIEKHKVAGVSPLEKNHKQASPPWMGGIRVAADVRVKQPPEACYRYWRDFKNLPLFMSHLDSVEIIDSHRSHWTVEAPADTTIEWDAEILEDIPNKRISWRSLEKAQVDNAGSVAFIPLENGLSTHVKVTLTYNPVLGSFGDALAELFGQSPDQQLADDLQRFKSTLEHHHSFSAPRRK